MLSQFKNDGDKRTLVELYHFPKDVYPIGRLDYDSEGLLILSNDKRLVNRLLNPRYRHKRSYWVQVEGNINVTAVEDLKRGVEIKIDGMPYFTKRAEVKKIDEPLHLPQRFPPIRYRASKPTSWIEITLTEGKNRQVRKMTAQVGFPTLRLIRFKIEDLTLPELTPGGVWEINRTELLNRLNILENSF
jgi:23S rRNA pseudouridine2457 synthase